MADRARAKARTMRAGMLSALGRVACVEAPVPRPDPGQVLLRTTQASVCGSDVHIVYHGVGPLALPAPPGYPGHESVGVVVEGQAGSLRAGERVLAVPTPAAARAFAEYQVVDAGQVMRLPADRPDEDLLLAQQLGTVNYALRRFWPWAPGRAAVVIGAGSAGLLFCQQLVRAGFEQVVVVDLRADRLEQAAALGATAVVDAAGDAAAELVAEHTAGQGAELVVEAAGYDEARALAAACVAPEGRLGLFGLPERTGLSPFPLESLFRRKATVEFQYGAQSEPGLRSFHEAVEQICSGTVQVRGMINRWFGIGQLPEALALAAEPEPGVSKVGIAFA